MESSYSGFMSQMIQNSRSYKYGLKFSKVFGISKIFHFEY